MHITPAALVICHSPTSPPIQNPVSASGRMQKSSVSSRRGIERDGRPLKLPMAFAWYANMTNDDLDALVAWLRSVPPLQ